MNSPKKKRDIDETEEKYIRKGNERRRKQLEKEYFGIKNLEIILVDFVPYERKEDMITGLKELFKQEGNKQPSFIDEPPFHRIPDIKEGGVFSGGGTVHLGRIYNSDLDWQPLHASAQKQLPPEFMVLDVTLGQFVDFAYYIVYVGVIKEKYRNDGIKKIFVESGDWVRYTEKIPDGKEIHGRRARGPKLEPTICKYQKSLESFLKPYSCGVFLNRDSDKDLSCPNLKVLATQKIDFKNFKAWEKEHLDFLRFIGFDLFYSKFDNMLVGYYPGTIFRERSIFEGLVFLGSASHYKGSGYETPEDEISYLVPLLIWQDLAPLLQSIYWPSFVMEVDRRKWENEIQSRLKEIQDSREESEFIRPSYDRTIDSHRRAGQFFIEENRNIESMKRYTGFLKRLSRMTEPLDSDFVLRVVNLFEDMLKYADSLLDMEKDVLKHLKDQSDLLFRYADNLTDMNLSQTNISLQRSMKWMTWAMLILTGVATALTFINWVWNVPPQFDYGLHGTGGEAALLGQLLLMVTSVILGLFCYFVVRWRARI